MLVSLFSQTCEDLPDLLKGHDPTIVKNELSAIFALGVEQGEIMGIAALLGFKDLLETFIEEIEELPNKIDILKETIKFTDADIPNDFIELLLDAVELPNPLIELYVLQARAFHDEDNELIDILYKYGLRFHNVHTNLINIGDKRHRLMNHTSLHSIPHA